MSSLAFHYTPFGEQILKEGRIRLEVGMVLPGDRRCVWLTTSPVWEPTCFKQIKGEDVHDPIELARSCGGLHRIGVSTDWYYLRTIQQWRKESGCHPLMQAMLIDKTAEQFGVDPENNWRVSFRPIDWKFWKTVERSEDGVHWEVIHG